MLLLFPIDVSHATGRPGSSKGGPGGSKGPDVPSVCNTILEMPSQISIFDNFAQPYGRRSDAVFPAIPNPWTGSKGTTSSTDNSKYFLVVKITSSECSNYSKTYVWKDSDTDMIINVPIGISYRVKLEYREQCGGYYGSSGNFTYKTTKWRWERVYNDATPQISTGHLVYISTTNC